MNCYYDALLGMCICVEESEIVVAFINQISALIS